MITSKLRFVENGEESIVERKASLRAYMKKRRADNENRDIKERLLVENTLALLAETVGAGTGLKAFCYLSYSSEAPTDKLIETLEETGYEVYCPRVDGGEMYAVRKGEDFTLSPLRIREPIGEATDAETDIVITPLLAVDERGNRLGYGGGYYDRYFAKNPRAVRIGYCFDFQILPQVPFGETDEQLHYIVTDKRIIKIK